MKNLNRFNQIQKIYSILNFFTTEKEGKNREKFLVKYIKSQIIKAEKQIALFDLEGHGKRSAYKDILFKLIKDEKNNR